MQAKFNHLRNQLLRAGVAPRHVTRYVGELAEHFEDLVAAERLAGRDREAAEMTAWTRLGDTDSLGRAMVSRKEFLSWAHRAPWAVFLVGPLIASIGAIVLGLLLLICIDVFMGSRSAHRPDFVPGFFKPLADAIAGFNLYLLPLLLGWAVAAGAVQRRIKPLWPILAMFIIAVLCGSQTYYIDWSTIPNGLENFGISWPFLPHGTWNLVAALRVLSDFAFTVVGFALWRSRPAYGE